MFCSNCGKELNENDQFCGNCGSKINNNTNIIVNNEIATSDSSEDSSEDSTINTNKDTNVVSNTETTTNDSYTNNNVNNNSYQNTNNQFSKVIITRLNGSKLFNRTPMKIIYNGGIITKIIAGEVLELEFPIGQHSVVFDANGDVQDYVINVEQANSMIYIDISVISELSHSSGIPKIQSVRSQNNVVPVNANYRFSYNDILNNSSKNNNSSYTGTYGIASVICVIIGLFLMGYAMSLSAITFGFLGMRRTKVLKNEKGDFLSIIGIIAGIIEFAFMLYQTFTF